MDCYTYQPIHTHETSHNQNEEVKRSRENKKKETDTHTKHSANADKSICNLNFCILIMISRQSLKRTDIVWNGHFYWFPLVKQSPCQLDSSLSVVSGINTFIFHIDTRLSSVWRVRESICSMLPVDYHRALMQMLGFRYNCELTDT